MLIKRVQLHNWKNFLHCDVEITDRCFIVGANASGKSNFIDAFRFLRDISKQAGGLQNAVETRGGFSKIRCLSARRISNVSITIVLGNEHTDIWKYHIDISTDGKGNIESAAKVNEESVFSYSKNEFVLNRKADDKTEDDETLKQTHLEQASQNQEFREIYNFLKNIEYLNVIPQLVRESSSANIYKGREDFYGRNFLERLSKMNDRTRSSYLRKINKLLEPVIPQLKDLEFVKDELGTPHLEAKFSHWRPKAGKQRETQFSDGTLRLIGLFFALLDSQMVMLLEEPEINLHSEIIKIIPEFIAKIQRQKKNGSQVIVTTHSYEMLQDKGISPHEVIVLTNTPEGTKAETAANSLAIKTIYDSGFSIADAVIPATKPSNIEKFTQLKIDS